MNYIISIVSQRRFERLMAVHDKLAIPISVSMMGRGTAEQSMLDLLGMKADKKRIVMAVANSEKTERYIQEIKEQVNIGVHGHGVVITIPIKSIGGGKMVNSLSEGEKPVKEMPQVSDRHELIVVIANEGRTDDVMDAARSAGATGGTVLHGKGSANEETARFLNISISSEKEVILIVALKEKKADIMRAVLEKAGPATAAQAITFSVPVATVAGFGL